MNDIKNSARLIAHTLLSHAKENSELTDEMIFLVIDRVETTMASVGQSVDKRELFEILVFHPDVNSFEGITVNEITVYSLV